MKTFHVTVYNHIRQLIHTISEQRALCVLEPRLTLSTADCFYLIRLSAQYK